MCCGRQARRGPEDRSAVGHVRPIDAVITAVARKTSPYSAVAWHHFHGAAARIAAEATAFGLRPANFLVPGDREQVRDAYGSNGARLRSLKRRFDPDGVFAFAIPLPE
jgi:hypothetical protein